MRSSEIQRAESPIPSKVVQPTSLREFEKGKDILLTLSNDITSCRITSIIVLALVLGLLYNRYRATRMGWKLSLISNQANIEVFLPPWPRHNVGLIQYLHVQWENSGDDVRIKGSVVLFTDIPRWYEMTL